MMADHEPEEPFNDAIPAHGLRLPSKRPPASGVPTPTIFDVAAADASWLMMERTLTPDAALNSAAQTILLSLPNLLEPFATTILLPPPSPLPNPAATISTLSASLATAQASITRLGAELLQAQLGSVSGVASAQSSAAASASSAVASISLSAATALASASALVANANAMALTASLARDSAIANASRIQVGLAFPAVRYN